MQLLIILIIILFAAYSTILLVYRAHWTNIPDAALPENEKLPSAFISVIIPARNEENNILACLNSMIVQSYPASLFEVIVIDDHSTDSTAKLVNSYVSSNIKLLSLTDHLRGSTINSYKKKALELGISQAKGEIIVTTDADCEAPNNWLQYIATAFGKEKIQLLVMPVAVNCSAKFREMFESIDFMAMQGITGAAVHSNKHSMCNGANLAYKTDAFHAVEGFKGIDRIASGDDMLLMHKIRKAFPSGISYLKSREVIMQTKPAASIREFMNQRIRWASKSGHYEDKSIDMIWALLFVLNLGWLIMAITVLVKNPAVYFLQIEFSMASIFFGLLLLKILVELFFLYPVAGFFSKRRMLWLFPLMQPFHILYVITAGIWGITGTYQWKGRKVK